MVKGEGKMQVHIERRREKRYIVKGEGKKVHSERKRKYAGVW